MNYKNLTYKLAKYDVYKKDKGMIEIEYFYKFSTTLYDSWNDNYVKGYVIHAIRELYDANGNTISTSCKLNINNVEEYSKSGTPIKNSLIKEDDLKIILSNDKINILNIVFKQKQ